MPEFVDDKMILSLDVVTVKLVIQYQKPEVMAATWNLDQTRALL